MKAAEEPNDDQDRERNPEQPQQKEPSHSCTPGVADMSGWQRSLPARGSRSGPLRERNPAAWRSFPGFGAGPNPRTVRLDERAEPGVGRWARGLLPSEAVAIMSADACARGSPRRPRTRHEDNERILPSCSHPHGGVIAEARRRARSGRLGAIGSPAGAARDHHRALALVRGERDPVKLCDGALRFFNDDAAEARFSWRPRHHRWRAPTAQMCTY